MFLKWLKIPHSKNFTVQKLKFLDVTKGICVKPGSALIHAHHRVRSLQVARHCCAARHDTVRAHAVSVEFNSLTPRQKLAEILVLGCIQ